MSLVSSLIAIRGHKAGESASRGGTWLNERDTRPDVVMMDHGNGYPHVAPSGTPVLVNSREVPIVGRVTMDMVCVGLGSGAQGKAGDPAILWGEGLPVKHVAGMTKVSVCKLVTHPTSRVATKYINQQHNVPGRWLRRFPVVFLSISSRSSSASGLSCS